MASIKKLNISIQFDNKPIVVGEMIQDKQQIYFKYNDSFLDLKINISPFKLKLTNQLQSTENIPFNGLFGVFNDSLPDGWGKLLLDRTLTSKGISINKITPLDRLAYVGLKGKGALTYQPEIINNFNFKNQLDLDKIANEVNLIINDKTDIILDELFQIAGSSGGARPKINIGFNPITNHVIHHQEILPKNYEHWLIKYPSTFDQKDIANIEFAYYKMALDCGIEMSKCKLFKGKNDTYYFGTKRFDRINNAKIHLHSASGLLHDDYRFSNLDYGHLMDCAFRLENDVNAYKKILKIATFNVFTHNRDDHSKNMSFLMDKNGKWDLAPAYDLTFSTSSNGFHSTMIAGESKNPTENNLTELAKVFTINKPNYIFEQVKDIIANWKKYADDCGVSTTSKNSIFKELIPN